MSRYCKYIICEMMYIYIIYYQLMCEKLGQKTLPTIRRFPLPITGLTLLLISRLESQFLNVFSENEFVVSNITNRYAYS